MKVYKWSKKNSHFLTAQPKHIGFGGPKCALWLDEKLRSGMSEPCETFESPSLSRSSDFNCYGVELWGFVMPESSSLVSGSGSGSIGGVVVR
mmetsp:Transcript_14908/g.20743  ORF Transcript_14908/g.20743 Transcript_14908/m.20743 type:complete len:92 (+) Transcript_14908:1057-1332(+)